MQAFLSSKYCTVSINSLLQNRTCVCYNKSILIAKGCYYMKIVKNKLIKMESVTHTTGDIEPIRFDFENEDHTIQKIEVKSVLGHQETNYVGQACIRYICIAEVDNLETMFELKYQIATHRWVISRILS